MPWVPRAAQAGIPHSLRASQSNTPSATTAQDAPSRPSPRTGFGPGSAWKRGERSGSMARPASQRTRPAAISGTTTIPAKRSPRPVKSPLVVNRSPGKPAEASDARRPAPGA